MIEHLNRVREGIRTSNCEAVLANGVDHFTYLTQVVLPFASNFPDRKAAILVPREGKRTIICPYDWSEAILDQGWEENMIVYDDNRGVPPAPAVEAIAAELKQLGTADRPIGIDTERTSASFMELLVKAVPHVTWLPIDQELRDWRMIKTRHEIDLLETAVKEADKSIVGALNHAEGAIDNLGYTLAEFTERIRVHLVEFGGSGVGHQSALQGKETQKLYSPPCGIFVNGNLVRIDVTTHHRGYWSNVGRMAVIGQPSKDQIRAYRENHNLKAAAAELLRPGAICADIFNAVRRIARESRVPFWENAGIGHSVGASEREAPYLDPGDKTKLEPGMVMVLDLYTYGPGKELIHSKDTYEITVDTPRLLSWYRSWDSPYVVTGYRALH